MGTWIVIVNYRTPDLAVDCLRSLSSQVADLQGGRVVVVDNASADGSVNVLRGAIGREGWAGWASVMAMERNGGFAYGNNAGIRAAMTQAAPPEYVLLLNPDTVAHPGALRALIDFMGCHPGAGIAGSRLLNGDGGIDGTAHNAPSPLGELDAGARLGVLSRLLHRHVVTPPTRDVAHECDWVSGASLMVRRQAFEGAGLLDEGFFLYFEEVDFCSRARAAGWQVWYVPQSCVVHLEGASTGIRTAKRRRARYWYDSRLRYFVKHWGTGGLLLADVLWAAGRASYLLRRAVGLGAQREMRDPAWFSFDLLWGDLRALLSGRASEIRRVRTNT